MNNKNTTPSASPAPDTTASASADAGLLYCHVCTNHRQASCGDKDCGIDSRAAQPVQAGAAVDEHEQAIDLMRKLERDGLEFVCMDGSANVVGIIKAAWKYRASLAPVAARLTQPEEMDAAPIYGPREAAAGEAIRRAGLQDEASTLCEAARRSEARLQGRMMKTLAEEYERLRLAAPVSAQQGAAEQHNAVECDSALRAEPASQHEAGIAVLSALRDGVELKEPVHISKAVLAQREARVSLSGGTGPVACVMLVNIQLTPWADGPEKAEAFASGYNTAMKWYRSALLELADKVSAEFATRCRAEGGNTSNNEVSDLAAKAPAAQAVVMPDDWEEVVQSLEESYAGDSSLEWQGRAAQIIRLLAASPASTPEAAHADDTALNYNAGLVRKGIRDAVAAHALQPAAPGEPVAIIGSGYAILWLGGEPIAHIVERHGIKVGDVLYTAAPTASAATTELEKEVSIMYQMLDDGEWAEHVAKTCLGQQLETAITRAIGRVKSGAATTSEDGLEQLLIEHRIGLTPENEGGFHAYVYGDQELFKAKGYGQTPREAIDAAMRATQQEGGK